VKYLVAPLAALLCAVSTILPATAAPSPSASITFTCDRGTAGADVYVWLYAYDGSELGLQRLFCGTANEEGERSDRIRLNVSEKPFSIQYSMWVGGQHACAVSFAQLPERVSCTVGTNSATLAVR
jgi:hypothetical protein